MEIPKHSGRDKHSGAVVAGSPKKGGGGGKFTWGVGGKDDLQTESVLDKDDPNYDSEEEAQKKVSKRPQSNFQYLEQYKKACRSIASEYFESEDVGEVTRSLQEQGMLNLQFEFVKEMLTAALERQNRERELTSCLFSSLYGTVLPAYQIADGFRVVLDRAGDLVLDTPNAAELIGSFLARAIVDDILPPAFLSKNLNSCPAAAEALAKASRLLEGKYVAQHLEHVWGPGRSINNVKASMRLAAQEFLIDGADFAEAERSLRELNVPTVHFHFVKIVLLLALESTLASDRTKLSGLLKGLCASDLISSAHLVSGFQAAVDTIAEITKDCGSDARNNLLAFCDLAIQDGYLEASFKAKAEAQTLENLEEDVQRLAADTERTVLAAAQAAAPAETTPVVA